MDFTIHGGGSVYVLTPISDAAKEWANEHLPEDAPTFGRGIVVEHRYIADIVNGIEGDGLSVVPS